MEANLARKCTTSVTVIFVKCKMAAERNFAFAFFRMDIANEPMELGPVKFGTEVVHTRSKYKFGEGTYYSGYFRKKSNMYRSYRPQLRNKLIIIIIISIIITVIATAEFEIYITGK